MRQVYDNITERMFGHSPMRADEAPEGLILHSAGQGEQGFYVYDVWESREDFERFMDVIRQIDNFFVTVVKLAP